ncbi:MAG TPA: o-succinylbenzoate synthase [Trueperaceae bacterium]|nr:o-succinylbenzoate synthase [Trueperaceae bacterium]
MIVERVELRELQVELNFRFETSFGVEQDLRKLLLVVHSNGLEGYGEVTAGTVPGYSYETTATAWTALVDYVLPRVVGHDFATPAQLLKAVAGIRGHNMAIGAVETAFWDLQAKAAGLPLWQLLGGVRTEIAVGASIGIQKSLDETVAVARRHAEEGYKRLKFKIKPGWDVEPLRAVRDALPAMALTVDANSAYALTDTRVFQQLDELGLDYIEQPLAHDDLFDHAKLQAGLNTALCLDESVHSAADARKGLEIDAGRVINVKVGRLRGHLESRGVHDVAAAFGAPVWCGGMLELGVGRAHNLHLSTLANFTLPGDTASATRYWGDNDIIEEKLDAVDGIQSLPASGAGLGVTLRYDLIDKLTVRAEAA